MVGLILRCMEAAAAKDSQKDRIVVMKFGGTSVAGPEEIKRAAARIVAAREDGGRVVSEVIVGGAA